MVSHFETHPEDEFRLDATSSPEGPLGTPRTHQRAGTVMRLLTWLSSLATVITAVALLMPTLTTANEGWPTDLSILLAIGILLSTALCLVTKGVKSGKPWARIGGIVCGAGLLIGFPVGTLIGSYLLWLLLFKWRGPSQA